MSDRMAVVERSLFLLDFSVLKYQEEVMSCSLEQENILTVTLQPVLNYFVASEFLLLIFFHLWSVLPWVIDPFWCSDILWIIVAFCFQNSLWTCRSLSESCFDNIVLIKEEHQCRRVNGAVLQALCCSPKFQLLCKFLISGRRPRQCFLQTCDNREQGNERWFRHRALCLVSESHRLILVHLPSHWI